MRIASIYILYKLMVRGSLLSELHTLIHYIYIYIHIYIYIYLYKKLISLPLLMCYLVGKAYNFKIKLVDVIKYNT